MTRLLTIVALVAVIAVVGIIGSGGCGARVGVAKDKILARIDKALGELDVKRKKIEIKQKEIRGQMDEVRKSLYRSRASLENVKGKINKSKASKKKIEGQIKRLQQYVSDAKASPNKTVEINSETFTGADLDKMAQQIAGAYRKEEIRIDGFESSIAALSESVTFLEQQDKTSRAMMTELDLALEIIDTKKESLDTVRSNAITSGENKSLTEELATLQKEVEELSIDVDVDFQMEQDRMADIGNQADTVDEILQGSSGLDATEDLLNGLLGEGDGE